MNKDINITQEDAKSFKDLLIKNWHSYKAKPKTINNTQWLEEMLKRELPELEQTEIKNNATEIVESISVYDENLKSITTANQNGIKNEQWVAKKLEESATGLSVQKYGQTLQNIDNVLFDQNLRINEALSRVEDGNIKMSYNLDGNIAEHMIANSAELSGVIQGKNIKVEVRDVFTPNSVDVRATNLDSGKFHNYQLKFGQDAKATINLIERGNYNNQQIVVPTEQLGDVQAHFKAKGSSKTIVDHIDAFGIKGNSFTKAEMKQLQLDAQNDGIMPSMNYNDFQNKELALSIGKNASLFALQSAVIITGVKLASDVWSGKKFEPDELIETAIKTGADTGLKVVTAGTLQVAIRKGFIKCLPKSTPAGAIANIACVGIENVKVLSKVAKGELTMTQGINQMARVSVSMTAGLLAMGKCAAIGTTLGTMMPVLGVATPVVASLITGTIGYMAGSKIGEKTVEVARKISKEVKPIAKKYVEKAKEKVKACCQKVKAGCQKLKAGCQKLKAGFKKVFNF